MRLLRLSLQGIGPFRDRFDIDVGPLAQAGLFLLEGPTGSGKSTLLDSVMFALYGSVAAEDSSQDRLVSAHLLGGFEPFVDLVFETGAGVYRVRRSPAFLRSKVRGLGTTTQNATVKLWRLIAPPDPSVDSEGLDRLGDIISARVAEADIELVRIIGLTRVQFTQTVLLPQGQFAAFLRAKPDDRAALLQQIFGTRDFDQLRIALQVQRKVAVDALRDQQIVISTAAQVFVSAIELKDSAALYALASDPAQGAACRRLAAELVEAAAGAAAEHVSRAAAARVKDEAAVAQLAALEQQAKDLAVWRLLRAEQARLHLQLDAIVELEGAVERAGYATAVVPIAAAAARAEQRSARARAELEGAVSRLPVGSRDTSAAHWRDERDAFVAQAQVLTTALAVEQSLPQLAEQLSAVTAALDLERTRQGALQVRLMQLPEQLSSLEQALAELDGADARVESATMEFNRARAVHQAASALLSARAEATQADARVSAAAAQAQDLNDQVHALQAARIAAMAGELAGDLQTGQPCPVCGAREHPAPATRLPEQPDAAAVAAGQRRVHIAEATLGQAVAFAKPLADEVVRLSAYAQGVDVEPAALVVATADAAVVAARSAAMRADQLRRDLLVARADEQKLREQWDQILSSVHQGEMLADQRREDHSRARDTVEQARGPEWSVDERLRQLQLSSESLRSAIEAAAAATDAAADFGRCHDDLVKILVTQGFESSSVALAAALADLQVRDARERISAHRAAVSTNLTRLAGLAHVDPSAVVDLDSARQSRELTARDLDAANQAATLSQQLTTAGRLKLAVLSIAVSTADDARQAAAPLQAIADLVNGQGANVSKLPLQSYVLMNRFSEVLSVANHHLATMSSGRYSLEHSSDKQSGALKTGLGIVVADLHTSSTREITTLSGGETFWCSLALALALADIVQAEAGGVDLGTLFVDEGFGSLDPESLERVLVVLGGLRSGGRTVGVVSHVEEMKSRISERISVRPQPGGWSTLRVIA